MFDRLGPLPSWLPVMAALVLGCGGEASVARVNGEWVPEATVDRAVRAGLDGVDGDATIARQAATEALIRETALVQEARRAGLVVSEAEIAVARERFAPFLEEDGSVDPARRDGWLDAVGHDAESLDAKLGRELLVRKLELLVGLGTSVDPAVVEERFRERHTRVNLRFVRTRPESMLGISVPEGPALEAWAAAHEPQVRARYAETADAWSSPELVTLRMIRLAVNGDPEAVRSRLMALRAEVAAGARFDELARRWSEDPSAAEGGDVGDVVVSELAAGVLEAIHAGVKQRRMDNDQTIPRGTLSMPLLDETEGRIYEVKRHLGARDEPLEQVRLLVAAELYPRIEAPSRARDFARAELLPGWRGVPDPAPELLAKHGLRVQSTGLVTTDGSDGQVVLPPGALRAALGGEVGEVIPQVFLADDVAWVVQVAERIDADMALFEEQGPALRAEALAERRADRFAGFADQIAAQAEVRRTDGE